MIPIVFSTDHNYIMPTGVTIASLLAAGKEETYDIYIMAGGDVTKEDQDKLIRQTAELSPDSRISFIDMSRHYSGAHETRGITKATYYRLMIPWLIPDVDKIIYSDVDVIFKSPITPLYETDLDGKLIAGALTSDASAWSKYKKYFDSIGVDYTRYFNAGILVLNSKLMREEKMNLKFEILAKKKFLYQDQDILNIACKDRVAFFDRRYNLSAFLYGTEDRYTGDVIIHYAGDKPWITFTYAWAQWWEIYNESLFADGRFYHEISRKILDPKEFVRNLMKKASIQVELLRKRFT